MLTINNTMIITNTPPTMDNTYKHILYSDGIYYGETIAKILQTSNDRWINQNSTPTQRQLTQSMGDIY